MERPAEHREDPAHGAPCIRPAVRRAERPAERVLASANAPAWVRVPALDSVRALAEHRAWCRLRVKRLVRSVPLVDMRAVDASSIKRPRKAR